MLTFEATIISLFFKKKKEKWYRDTAFIACVDLYIGQARGPLKLSDITLL